jgi:hypothetical protein
LRNGWGLDTPDDWPGTTCLHLARLGTAFTGGHAVPRRPGHRRSYSDRPTILSSIPGKLLGRDSTISAESGIS